LEPSKKGLKEKRRLDKVWEKILNTILRKVQITKKERWVKVAKGNKKSLTKHDLLRAIKQMAMQLQMINNQVLMIDNIVDSYIRMNKDDKKLEAFIVKEIEKKKKDAQNTEHKQSGRSAKTSK
jgi:hypothetical protein